MGTPNRRLPINVFIPFITPNSLVQPVNRVIIGPNLDSEHYNPLRWHVFLGINPHFIPLVTLAMAANKEP